MSGSSEGVRKVSGARPRDLIFQFIGESVIYSVVSILVALAAVEVLLPAFNGFLQRDMSLSYTRDLASFGLVLVLGLVTGTAAGVWCSLASVRPLC